MDVAGGVTVVEVGPRDGLQNERDVLAVPVKVRLIGRLVAAGLRVVEAGAFVSPKWVPQMADTAEVLARLERGPDVRHPVLVPNLTGLERARAAEVEDIAVFAAASETFSKKNINCTIEESLERYRGVCIGARDYGMRVRGYVSCVLGCPYEGEIAPKAVVEVSRALYAMGCDEVSLGDTIGVGTPGKARELLQVVAREIPVSALAVHFHDTYGQALANIYACLEAGVRVVDSSVGGLGGCPYARGASGNVATEDVVYMLHGLGFSTGVDLEAVVATAQWISEVLGRSPASRVARALKVA